MTRQTFVATLDKIECRESRSGKHFTLTGHAAVYNRWSDELHTFAGSFREKIAPGAFRNVLRRKPDVRLLFNHDANFPLARTKSGTLELTEDDQGLAVRAQLAPTSFGNDLRMAMERGDVDQMSFAFTVGADEWDDSDKNSITRTIREFDDLFDVSVVTYPAYPDTDAVVREIRAAADAGKITLDLGFVAERLGTAEWSVANPEIPNPFIQAALEGNWLTPENVREIEVWAETRDSAEPVDEDEPGDADETPEEPEETGAEVEEPPAVDEPAVEEASDAHLIAELRQNSQDAVAAEKKAYLRLLREITK